MDYEPIRAGMEQVIPFNHHLGLEVHEVGDGRATVRLPEGEQLPTTSAAARRGLFSAGEAASGGAFAGAFAEHMGSITPLAKWAGSTT